MTAELLEFPGRNRAPASAVSPEAAMRRLEAIFTRVCGEPPSAVDMPFFGTPAIEDWRSALESDIHALWEGFSRRERLIAAIAAGREMLRRRV